jgi:hypothetical protein
MTHDERVTAVADLGFTDRQARFLVLVTQHGGVCVPRQYAAFAGTAYGRWVAVFFRTLAKRGWASASLCLHNRAVLYHVRDREVYEAVGEPDSPYRRSMSVRQALERVMLLDVLIGRPRYTWLGTQQEKVDVLCRLAPGFPPDRLPHSVTTRGDVRRVRLFPDRLPIGIASDNDPVVFPYLITTPFKDALLDFVQRHSDLWRALPRWTVRLVFPREAAAGTGSFEAAVRQELTTQLAPDQIAELRWLFKQRQAATDVRALSHSDERFWLAEKMFAMTRYQILYRRWLMDGDAVLDLVTSSRIGDALASGAGSIEAHVLRHGYRHLSRMEACQRSTHFGVEKRDETLARPQPQVAPGQATYRERWRRMVAAANRLSTC